MPALQKKRYAIQSVEKALDVLEAISELDGNIGVTSLSERLAMSKSTTFRLLATLEKRGYVEQKAAGSYRVGMSAFETGQKLLGRMELLRKAKPVMEGLAREVNESVYLAALIGGEALMVDVIETTRQVQVLSLAGRRFPLESTPLGKVVRAYGNTSDSNVETDRIQRREICIESGFFGEGISSLTVPLLNAIGIVEGGLCLVCPTFRIDHERVLQELIPPLKSAGQLVSSQLGYLDHLMS